MHDFKDIFPGLSSSWNFHEKIHDFPGGVGTLATSTQGGMARLSHLLYVFLVVLP